MKKSTVISLIALGVAIAGALIALVAFLKRSRCTLCEDFEDEDMSDLSLDDEMSAVSGIDLEESVPEESSETQEEEQVCADCCENCAETVCEREEISPDATVEPEKE